MGCADSLIPQFATLDGVGLRRLRAGPPDAVAIDLSRRPSQGRDLGLNLRQYVATRRVPLVFVGGQPDEVERIRAFLPDAHYTTWPEIDGALKVDRPALFPPRFLKACGNRLLVGS